MVSVLLDLLREAVELFASIGYAILAILIGVSLSLALILAVELGFEVYRFGGEHLVLCPHHGVQGRVRLRALRAALWSAASDDPPIRVRSCSLDRGPSCDQACLVQLGGERGRTDAHRSGPEVRI